MRQLPEAVEHERGYGFDGKRGPDAAHASRPARRRIILVFHLGKALREFEQGGLPHRYELKFKCWHRTHFALRTAMKNAPGHLNGPLSVICRRMHRMYEAEPKRSTDSTTDCVTKAGENIVIYITK